MPQNPMLSPGCELRVQVFGSKGFGLKVRGLGFRIIVEAVGSIRCVLWDSSH